MKRENLNKLCSKIKYMLLMAIWVLQSKVFATSSSSISTAEVSQATENIKNAVIKLAMPIRRNIGIC